MIIIWDTYVMHNIIFFVHIYGFLMHVCSFIMWIACYLFMIFQTLFSMLQWVTVLQRFHSGMRYGSICQKEDTS